MAKLQLRKAIGKARSLARKAARNWTGISPSSRSSPVKAKGSKWTGTGTTTASKRASLDRQALRNKNIAYHAKMTGKAQREFAQKRKAAAAAPLQSAQSRFRAHPRIAAKAVVGKTHAQTSLNFALARSKRASALQPALRKAAANEIRRSRAASPGARGLASGGKVGHAKLWSSSRKAVPHTQDVSKNPTRYFRVSRHGGKTSVKYLGGKNLKRAVDPKTGSYLKAGKALTQSYQGKAKVAAAAKKPLALGRKGVSPGLKTNLLKKRGSFLGRASLATTRLGTGRASKGTGRLGKLRDLATGRLGLLGSA